MLQRAPIISSDSHKTTETAMKSLQKLAAAFLIASTSASAAATLAHGKSSPTDFSSGIEPELAATVAAVAITMLATTSQTHAGAFASYFSAGFEHGRLSLNAREGTQMHLNSGDDDTFEASASAACRVSPANSHFNVAVGGTVGWYGDGKKRWQRLDLSVAPAHLTGKWKFFNSTHLRLSSDGSLACGVTAPIAFWHGANAGFSAEVQSTDTTRGGLKVPRR